MTSKHFSVLTFLISGSALELTSTGTHGSRTGERGGTAVAAGGTEETEGLSGHCSSLEGEGFPESHHLDITRV